LKGLVKICLGSIAGLTLAIFPAIAQDDVIKVESSLVIMNATIRDAQGRPVGGLTRKEFKVFQDGVQQEIAWFETQETPFAAVVLLDTSGSMSERISIARSAAINFLDGLRPDDMAAVYRFDSRVTTVQDFSDSRDVSDKIFDLKAQGQTILNDAILKAARDLQNRSEKRKAIIVVSDGADTFSGSSAEKALKSALAAGATIYTVDMSTIETNGVERRQNQGVLRNFAEKTGGVFVSTENGLELRNALRNIVSELGVQYTVAFDPGNIKRDGKWHSLELRVAHPNLTIRTRQGYNAPKD
jgi:Ca-activated chloride channel family protein